MSIGQLTIIVVATWLVTVYTWYRVAKMARVAEKSELVIRIKQMEMSLVDLDDRLERLLHMHKNLRSSFAMRKKRENDLAIENETPEQWKQRKRAELALKGGAK